METPLHEEPQTEVQKISRREAGIGPFAAIVIVIILLVLGGMYFLIEQAAKHNQPLPTSQELSS